VVNVTAEPWQPERGPNRGVQYVWGNNVWVCVERSNGPGPLTVNCGSGSKCPTAVGGAAIAENRQCVTQQRVTATVVQSAVCVGNGNRVL